MTVVLATGAPIGEVDPYIAVMATQTRPRPSRPAKLCATCGRPFEMKPRLTEVWDEVKYCSAGCRRHKPGRVDRSIEEQILALLADRSPQASLCPSEVAKRVFGNDWRPEMERVRRAARRLVARGRVEIIQKGKRVDGTSFRGPIRIRLPR